MKASRWRKNTTLIRKQPRKIKRAIYLRTFSALLAAYLVLMTAFSLFLLDREKEDAAEELSALTSQGTRIVEGIMQEYPGTSPSDRSEMRKALLQSSIFPYTETEMALFSGDYELLFHTDDSWLIHYGVKVPDRNYYASHYSRMVPRDWFTEEEVVELEQYLTARPAPKKEGELSGYYVDLKGFWIDGDRAIPETVTVQTMYARSFDENGRVISSSTVPNDTPKIYLPRSADTGVLPYIKSGGIQLRPHIYTNKSSYAALRKLVTDKNRLEHAINHDLFQVTSQRIKGFTYHFYSIHPYQSSTETLSNGSVYSDYWTVMAREVNLLDRCKSTLGAVWAGCLALFLTTGAILSAQTYRTYRKREELEQYRRETAHALAHDLKTPLSVISGYSQNLIENIHTAKREHYAQGIQKNVTRMDKIIRDMLELSRLESDSVSLSLQLNEISLQELCAGVLEVYKPLFAEKGIVLTVEGDAVIRADRELIGRVLDNFAANALEHTPEGGTFGIQITAHTLECHNSGSQIPEDMTDAIWEPYRKADHARSNPRGTGLGLSIARTILELHGFSYGVRNTEDGVTFWFKYA